MAFINRKLIGDVDSLLNLFNTEVISLIDMNETQQKQAIDDFIKSASMSQLEDVCQGLITKEYIDLVIRTEPISHIILLKVNKLVVAYAFLTEKNAQNGRRYMYIDIICSRKHSSTGKHMLIAAENLALRRGITFTSLSSVFEAIGFYKKMGYNTIPVEEACGKPNSGKIGDDDILRMFQDAKSIIDLHYTPSNRNVPMDTNITKMLSWMRFTQDQIGFIIENFNDHFENWEYATKNVNISDYFEDQLLLMTKCLINSNTVSIFNSGL